MKKSTRILWAINPALENESYVRLVSKFAESLKDQLIIDPVYVIDDFKQNAKRDSYLDSLKGTLKSFEPSSVLSAPQVLHSNAHSILESVKCLLSYAEMSKSDFILLGSKNRKGLKKLNFGSFSSLVLEKSEFPILAFNPEKNDESKMANLHYATDFSHESLMVFIKFAALAKGLNADLSVAYHHSKNQSDNPSTDMSEKVKIQAIKKSKLFLNLAKKCNINAKFELITSNDSRLEAIANFVTKNSFQVLGISSSV